MKAGSKLSMLSLCVAVGIALAGGAHGALRPGTGGLGNQEPDGKALYLKNCRKCHGATGEPSAQNRKKYKDIKSLADAEFMSTVSDDSIMATMMNGAGKDMKSFKEKLTQSEMAAVTKYVRTLAVPNVE